MNSPYARESVGGAQPGTKAQADTELPGGAKSLTTSHNYANPPKRECSTSLHVIQGYPRTGDSCPCTGLFASTVLGHLMNGRNGDPDKRSSRCQRCLTGHPQAMQIIEKNA